MLFLSFRTASVQIRALTLRLFVEYIKQVFGLYIFNYIFSEVSLFLLFYIIFNYFRWVINILFNLALYTCSIIMFNNKFLLLSLYAFNDNKNLNDKSKIKKKKELIIVQGEKLYKNLERKGKVKWKNILSDAIEYVNAKFPKLKGVEVKFADSTFRGKVYSLNKQTASKKGKNNNESKESILKKINDAVNFDKFNFEYLFLLLISFKNLKCLFKTKNNKIFKVNYCVLALFSTSNNNEEEISNKEKSLDFIKKEKLILKGVELYTDLKNKNDIIRWQNIFETASMFVEKENPEFEGVQAQLAINTFRSKVSSIYRNLQKNLVLKLEKVKKVTSFLQHPKFSEEPIVLTRQYITTNWPDFVKFRLTSDILISQSIISVLGYFIFMQLPQYSSKTGNKEFVIYWPKSGVISFTWEEFLEKYKTILGLDSLPHDKKLILQKNFITTFSTRRLTGEIDGVPYTIYQDLAPNVDFMLLGDRITSEMEMGLIPLKKNIQVNVRFLPYFSSREVTTMKFTTEQKPLILNRFKHIPLNLELLIKKQIKLIYNFEKNKGLEPLISSLKALIFEIIIRTFGKRQFRYEVFWATLDYFCNLCLISSNYLKEFQYKNIINSFKTLNKFLVNVGIGRIIYPELGKMNRESFIFF